jgi:hypothetical protein
VRAGDRGLLVDMNSVAVVTTIVGMKRRSRRCGSVRKQPGVGDEHAEDIGNGSDVENGLDIAECECEIGGNDNAESNFHRISNYQAGP